MQIFLRCVTAAIAISMAGCASSSPRPSAAESISAPLNLCASVDSPPKDIATQPGYVQFAVTVTDANGNVVNHLKQSDFLPYVPEHTLPIKYFHDDAGRTPQSIVLVLDESGSMANKLVVQDPDTLQKVRQNLAEATKRLNKCDELAVVRVGGRLSNDLERDDQVRIIQPLTTDHALVFSRIPGEHPFGQTPLYDGISKGLELIESAHYPNRAMIVVTDGLDNVSDMHLDEVIGRAKKDMVTIYVIGIGDQNAPAGVHEIAVGTFVIGGLGNPNRLDVKTIEELSTRSGGQYFIVMELASDKGSSFADAVGKVASAVGNSYSIGVIPPDSIGQTVTIALANPGKRRVNARPVGSMPASAQQ